MAANKMGRNENPVVVVVSLMEDQVKEVTLIILLVLPACVQLSSVDNYA